MNQRKREQLSRKIEKGEIIRAAILNGICNAKAKGSTKPYDIALEIQCYLEIFVDFRLPGGHEPNRERSERGLARAIERFNKEKPI